MPAIPTLCRLQCGVADSGDVHQGAPVQTTLLKSLPPDCRYCWASDISCICAVLFAKTYVRRYLVPPLVSFLPPGLPPRTFAAPFLLSYSVFDFYFFPLFFVSGPCARLSWPSRQLLSARKSTVSYRIVSCLRTYVRPSDHKKFFRFHWNLASK